MTSCDEIKSDNGDAATASSGDIKPLDEETPNNVPPPPRDNGGIKQTGSGENGSVEVALLSSSQSETMHTKKSKQQEYFLFSSDRFSLSPHNSDVAGAAATGEASSPKKKTRKFSKLKNKVKSRLSARKYSKPADCSDDISVKSEVVTFSDNRQVHHQSSAEDQSCASSPSSTSPIPPSSQSVASAPGKISDGDAAFHLDGDDSTAAVSPEPQTVEQSSSNEYPDDAVVSYESSSKEAEDKKSNDAQKSLPKLPPNKNDSPPRQRTQNDTSPPVLPKIKFNEMVQRVIDANSPDDDEEGNIIATKDLVIRNRDDAKMAAVLSRLGGNSMRFRTTSEDYSDVGDDDDEIKSKEDHEETNDDKRDVAPSSEDQQSPGTPPSTEDQDPSLITSSSPSPPQSTDADAPNPFKPKLKFNEMVQRVMETNSSIEQDEGDEDDNDDDDSEVGDGENVKNIIIRNREDAKKAAILQRLGTSFRFKSIRDLDASDISETSTDTRKLGTAKSARVLGSGIGFEGGSNDSIASFDDIRGPKHAQRRLTSIPDKHRKLERGASIGTESPSTRDAGNSVRGVLMRAASSASFSSRNPTSSFEKADYAGFTGLRKLCNAVMLDGRQDKQWNRVRTYLEDLDPEEARVAAEMREGEEEETALHLVCRQRPPPDVVQLLLQASRAPASWKSKVSGWTPLHLECRSGGNEMVVRLLLKAHREGASELDKQGRTPLHLATAKSVKTPPSFATLKRLMNKKVLSTYSNPAQDASQRSAAELWKSMESKKAATAATGCYPLTLEYLVERAEHIPSVSGSSELNHANDCIEMFLDSRIEMLEQCSHREASELISTLEGSPDWFQEQAGVHPYVQAILNWKIGQRFATAVMLLDFYVLIMLIACFRIASEGSLHARFYTQDNGSSEMNVGTATIEESCASTATGGSGGSHTFWFWTSSNQSPALYFYSHGTETCGANFVKNDDDDSLNYFGSILALYLGTFYLLMREVFQMISLARRGLFSSWLFDVWNYLDVSCISLVWLTTLAMHRGVGDNEDVKLLVVLTTGILWMMMLSFLKLTRRDFAVFVSGVIHVTVTLRSFLVTLGIFLAAFAQMYFTGFTGSERCVDSSTANTSGEDSDVEYTFCSAYGSYLKVYMMLLGGGVDESDFTINNVSLWLSIWFSFTVVIILLNVLIAIVTDSYQDVKSHGEAVFWNHRLSFIFEVDQIHDMCEDFLCRAFSFSCENDSDGSNNSDLKTKKKQRSFIMIDGSQLRALTRHFSKGLSNSGLSSSGRNILSSDPQADYSTDNDALGTLWEICLVAFENPLESSVWRRKCNLGDDWEGPKWLIGNMENPLIYPDRVSPSMPLRFLFAVLIPVWLVAGLLTAGLLWPPQVRKWCFCSHLTAEEKGHKLASNEEIKTMNDHAKEEMRDEIRKVERAMEAKMDIVKDQMVDMKESMDEVKTSLGAMKGILDALLEIEKRRSQREEEEKGGVQGKENQVLSTVSEQKMKGKTKAEVRFME